MSTCARAGHTRRRPPRSGAGRGPPAGSVRPWWPPCRCRGCLFIRCLVQRARDSAALTLPDVDALAPWMLGIDERIWLPHRCLSRRVPHGQARQRHAHRSPATTHPADPWPAGGRSIDPVWANRRLLLRAGDTLSDRARDRLSPVITTDDAAGKLQAAWMVKEQLRALLTTGSLADAAAEKDRLQALVERAARPETNRLWRTICRWWKENEVLIVTGSTTAKVEANNTAVKHIKRTGQGFTNARNYKTRILLRSAARTAARTSLTAERSPRTVKSRVGLPKGELKPNQSHDSCLANQVMTRPGPSCAVDMPAQLMLLRWRHGQPAPARWRSIHCGCAQRRYA